ncbi:MAG: hypothetical protein C0436_00560 [Alphaproteobacteria bacterium]|nr:hypothetical protein [Alphaproteobacteria bacterium]
MPEPKFIDDAPAPEPQFIDDAPKGKSIAWDHKSSDDDIIKALGYDPETVKKSKFYVKGMFKRSTMEPGGTASRLTSGPLFSALKGVLNVGAGVGQIATRLSPYTNDSDVAFVDMSKKFMDREWERSHTQDPTGKKKAEGITKGILNTSEFVGEAAPSLLVGGPTLGGAKVLSAQGAKQLGKIALAGGAQALTQPVDMGQESTNLDYLQKKAGQFGAGTLSAPVAAIGLEKIVAPLVGKTINVAKGKLGDAATEVEKLAQKFKIRTTAGDVTGATGTKKAEVLLESVPGVGMAAFRKAQGQEAKAAADAYVKKLGEAIDGEDWNLAVSKGVKSKLAEKSKVAAAMSDEMSVLAGKDPVKPMTLEESIKRFRAENGASGIPDETVEKELGTLARRLSGELKEGETPMDLSYDGLRALRSGLGKMAKKYETTDPVKARMYWDLKHSVTSDLNSFADNSGVPQLKDLNKRFNDYYSKEVAPYKTASMDYRQWAKALRGKDIAPEEIARTFIQSGKDGKAKYFYGALDDRGKAAVRAGLAQNALEAASVKTPTGDVVFSPAKFARYLEDQSSSTGVFFKGADKWELDGLTKIMRHVERAGQFAENPPTGNRLAQMAVGGGLATTGAVSPAAALGAWFTAKGSKLLLTTKAGKRLLLAASSLPPGSKPFQDLMDRELPKIAAISAGREPKPEETE